MGCQYRRSVTENIDARRTSFGAQADSYTNYRPGYPDQVFDYFIETVGRPASDISVIDIGAGTGQLTAGFVERGCTVTAVEPDDRMRAALSERIEVDAAVAGSAESIPLPDASADLVTGAQMWHWVDPVKAIPEVARVLRPGGVFSIIWSLRDDNADWLKAMEEVVDLPDSYKWFRSNDKPPLTEPFGEMALQEFAFSHTSTPEGLVGLVGTFSHVAISDDREAIKEGIRQLAATHPDLAGRQTFEVPYIAKVFTAIRGAH